jgi:protein-disulfide isomerase
MIWPMRRWPLILAGLGLLACQQGDPALQQKLDTLQAKLDKVQAKLEGLGSAQQRPQRPTPAPPPPDTTVFSVPVGDAAVRGPASAKVTIVEAADFA